MLFQQYTHRIQWNNKIKKTKDYGVAEKRQKMETEN